MGDGPFPDLGMAEVSMGWSFSPARHGSPLKRLRHFQTLGAGSAEISEMWTGSPVGLSTLRGSPRHSGPELGGNFSLKWLLLENGDSLQPFQRNVTVLTKVSQLQDGISASKGEARRHGARTRSWARGTTGSNTCSACFRVGYLNRGFLQPR